MSIIAFILSVSDFMHSGVSIKLRNFILSLHHAVFFNLIVKLAHPNPARMTSKCSRCWSMICNVIKISSTYSVRKSLNSFSNTVFKPLTKPLLVVLIPNATLQNSYVFPSNTKVVYLPIMLGFDYIIKHSGIETCSIIPSLFERVNSSLTNFFFNWNRTVFIYYQTFIFQTNLVFIAI